MQKSQGFAREGRAALRAVRKASAVALQYWRRPLDVHLKGDRSPVTRADRECNALLVRELARAFPGDGFLTEEGGVRPGRTGRCWVIDPIDGTRGFIRGAPFWGQLVGLATDEGVVAGAMAIPAMREWFWAARGAGVYLNGRRLAMGKRPPGSRPALVLGGLSRWTLRGRWPALGRLARKDWTIRQYGDCYAVSALLQGWADGWVEPDLAAWDVAALQVLVEEAGGRLTDDAGRALPWSREGWQGGAAARRTIVASSGPSHSTLTRLFQKH